MNGISLNSELSQLTKAFEGFSYTLHMIEVPCRNLLTLNPSKLGNRYAEFLNIVVTAILGDHDGNDFAMHVALLPRLDDAVDSLLEPLNTPDFWRTQLRRWKEITENLWHNCLIAKYSLVRCSRGAHTLLRI